MAMCLCECLQIFPFFRLSGPVSVNAKYLWSRGRGGGDVVSTSENAEMLDLRILGRGYEFASQDFVSFSQISPKACCAIRCLAELCFAVDFADSWTGLVLLSHQS